MAADHYQTLQVRRNATPEEIHDAYLRLVRTHHPDLNLSDPDAVARFKKIQQAYEVLSNRHARMRHDRALRSEFSSPRSRVETEAAQRRSNKAAAATTKPSRATPSHWEGRVAQRVPRGWRVAAVVACVVVVMPLVLADRVDWRSTYRDWTRTLAGNLSTASPGLVVELPADERPLARRSATPSHTTRFAVDDLPHVSKRGSRRDTMGAPLDGGTAFGSQPANVVLPDLPFLNTQSTLPGATSSFDSAESSHLEVRALSSFSEDSFASSPRSASGDHSATLSVDPTGGRLKVSSDDPAHAALNLPSTDSPVKFSDRLERMIEDRRRAEENAQAGYRWTSDEVTPALDEWERIRQRKGKQSIYVEHIAAPSSLAGLDPQPLAEGVLRKSPPPSWRDDPLTQKPDAATPVQVPLEEPPIPRVAPHSFDLPNAHRTPAPQPLPWERGLATNEDPATATRMLPPVPQWSSRPTSPSASSESHGLASPAGSTPREREAFSLPGAVSRLGRANQAQDKTEVQAGYRAPWNETKPAWGTRPYKTREDYEQIERRVYPSHAPTGNFSTPFGAAQRAGATPASRGEQWEDYEGFFDAP